MIDSTNGIQNYGEALRTETMDTDPVPHLVDSADAAVNKMSQLKGDLKGQAERVMEKARDAATTAYDKAAAKAKEIADGAPEQARMAKERAQQVAEQGTAKVRATVQDQPLAALGAGIALGFVVGWLLSGRSND